MAHAAAEKGSTPDAMEALGLKPAWASAFRSAAVQRAPGLARLYASTLMRAYQKAGDARSGDPPSWRQSWPSGYHAAISVAQCRVYLEDALSPLSPRIGDWLDRAFDRTALRLRAAPALTRTRARGPPRMQLTFDGGLPSALTLAHEVAHWLQMGGAEGVSRPPPAMLAAEAGALVVERLMLQGLVKVAPRAAYAVGCDDAVAMLVRHPARDAWEQAGGGPSAWRAAAARFAPGLDWSTPPRTLDRRDDPPGRVLAYAMAAAIAAPLSARVAQDAAACDVFAAWLTQGPAASLSGLSSLLPAALDDPALYLVAYDDAERWIESRLDD